MTPFLFLSAALMSPVSTPPSYVIEVSLEGCVKEVRLNDVPLFRPEEEAMTGQRFVGEYLLEGGNHVKIIWSDPTQRCEAEVRILREEGVIAEGNAESFIFDVPEKLPRWAWLEGQAIEEIPENLTLVWERYEELWALLDAKDIEGILSWYRAQDQELAQARGDSLEEVQGESRDFFSFVTTQAERSLRPLWVEDLELEVFGEGRLARIVNRFGRSPLYYMDDTADTFIFISPVFYLTRAGEWVPIR